MSRKWININIFTNLPNHLTLLSTAQTISMGLRPGELEVKSCDKPICIMTGTNQFQRCAHDPSSIVTCLRGYMVNQKQKELNIVPSFSEHMGPNSPAFEVPSSSIHLGITMNVV
jgi:hypothetical protein